MELDNVPVDDAVKLPSTHTAGALPVRLCTKEDDSGRLRPELLFSWLSIRRASEAAEEDPKVGEGCCGGAAWWCAHTNTNGKQTTHHSRQQGGSGTLKKEDTLAQAHTHTHTQT